jgi:hypothetical protein
VGELIDLKAHARTRACAGEKRFNQMFLIRMILSHKQISGRKWLIIVPHLGLFEGKVVEYLG